jgi:ABC-type multidrug transport system ATPase subunit
MTEEIIKTTGLSYRHGKVQQTLADLNISVPKGSIYGFLGPNGAGKTTTLRLLLGLLKLQTGKIEIFGKDFEPHRIEILKKVGSLIEHPSLYGHLQAKENLEVYRGLYGATKSRLEEVLKIVGLADVGSKKVKQFSLGMKQRLSIALALLPNPQLLVLDEPANGLDPTGIIELRELIKKLNKEEGMTIIMSSHQLSEIEKMVSHLGIISKGKMVFQGPLEELHRFQQQHGKLLVRTADNILAMKVLSSYNPDYLDGTLAITYQKEEEIAKIAKTLYDHQLGIYLLQPQQHNLEHLFIELTT